MRGRPFHFAHFLLICRKTSVSEAETIPPTLVQKLADFAKMAAEVKSNGSETKMDHSASADNPPVKEAVKIEAEMTTKKASSADVKIERPPPRNEPYIEPVNGIVQPPVIPPASRPGRTTNQLVYLKNVVVKGAKMRILFGYSKMAWSKSQNCTVDYFASFKPKIAIFKLNLVKF